MTFRRPNRGDGRVLLGVCAGLARRWDLQPRTVRIALAVTLVPFGAGLLVYAALALVMPADGASDAEAGWRGDIGRSIAEALVVLAAVLAVGLIASFAAGLALFGLGPMALLLASAALAAVVLIDHPRTWLLGVLTLALALPAALVELTDRSVARQAGELRVAITRPQDARPSGYRAGLGPLLLDLRDFDAESGTTTTVRARADLRTFVVALPPDRCFNLEIDYSLDRSWITAAAAAVRRRTHFEPSAAGYPLRAGYDGAGFPSGGQVTTLVAYGNAFAGAAGRYRRPVSDPTAPTLRLQLRSGRSQIIVRDFPRSIDPLAEPRWPTGGPPSLQDIGRMLLRAQRSAKAATPLGTPAQGDPTGGSIKAYGRPASAQINDALMAVRRRERYPLVQARKLAGVCAARSEVRRIQTRLARDLTRATRLSRRDSRDSVAVTAAVSLLVYQATMRELPVVKHVPSTRGTVVSPSSRARGVR